MIDNLDFYFEPHPDQRIVDLADLVPSKPPETQPESVANAEVLMQEAASGARSRRGPLSVTPAANGTFVILDGNATYGVAARHGWKALPVLVDG